MSYEATSVLEAEYRIDVSENSDREAGDKQWDIDNLTPLVRANAHVLVRCPWMNGEVVTLGTAMDNYQWNSEGTAPEDEPFLISIVYELLSNPVTETEEPEEDKPEEEEPVKAQKADQKSKTETKADNEPKNSNTTKQPEQPQKEINETKPLEVPVSTAATLPRSENSKVTEVEAAVDANLVQIESNQPIQGAAKAEAATSSSKSSIINETVPDFTAKRPLLKDQLDKTGSVSKSKLETKRPTPTIEIPKRYAAANPMAVTREEQSVTLPVATETATEPEFAKSLSLDQERVAFLADFAELTDEEIIEVVEYELADTNNLVNFVEADVLFSYLEEAVLDADEQNVFFNAPDLEAIEHALVTSEETSIFQLGDELKPSESTQTTNPEQLAQISLNIEEVESCLMQLAERTQAIEPETTEMVNECLNKIIEAPAKLEAYSGEIVITEAEIQEELEELFTKLLDVVGIDYSPQTIELLIYLTVKWHLTGEIQKLNNDEQTDELPHELGTHEIIKKLLLGMSTIKKATAQAYAIGNSALRLCSPQLNT